MHIRTQQENNEKLPIPLVEVPCVEFFPDTGSQLYVTINARSTVLLPSQKPIFHRGFLFLVKIDGGIDLPVMHAEINPDELLEKIRDVKIEESTLPQIQCVGNVPPIFHPHFTFPSGMEEDGGRWIDYRGEGEEVEENLYDYILRVARSLSYESAFVHSNAINDQAYNYYLQHLKNSYQEEYIPNESNALNESSSDPIAQRLSDIPNETDIDLVGSRNSRVKFRITKTHPPYTPVEKVLPDLGIDEQLNSMVEGERDFSPSHQFYLANNAFQSISKHIGWGQRYARFNKVEQGGILLGEVFKDPHDNTIYAIAQEAIAGRLAQGTSSYLEITHETWKEMLDDVDQLDKDFQVIGWYHTHPNGLPVFMSGTDRATQERFFGKDWQFAIVLNPQKQIWRSFYGNRSNECRGYVITSDPE